MDHDIRRTRIATLERYLQGENWHDRKHEKGDDSKIHSLFLSWYAEPFIRSSRTRTVAVAKRMLAELKKEQDREVHGQA